MHRTSESRNVRYKDFTSRTQMLSGCRIYNRKKSIRNGLDCKMKLNFPAILHYRTENFDSYCKYIIVFVRYRSL
jgi:hypothetical protein